MLVLVFLTGVLLSAQTPDDLTRGRKLYEGHCALCHGQTGTGGRGPSLAQPRLRHGSTEEDLITVIQQGIRGTEMMGAWQMTDREVKQVAAYVRTLGRVAKTDLPGNPMQGKQLFTTSGCNACHIVRGEGTSLGPELSEIGARRSAAYLREAVVNPGAAAPEGYLVVDTTTNAGKRITGHRVNEDSFTIQIQDAAGQYHSFRKSALKDLQKRMNQSTMPSYQDKLSAQELDDLTAYLAGLRGEQ